jgi:allophanate hydrolase subunit 2
MLTTVQDLGRWGLQGSGVPVAGPMDGYSHRLANRLVGNDEHAAALEVTLIGPELDADGEVLCAVAGARFALFAGNAPVPMHLPVGLPIRTAHRDAPAVPLPLPRDGGARLRVIRGPHEAMFTPAAYETLFGARFRITPSSNRMGYRLEGPALEHRDKADILSDATPFGSLQVPASGQVILLMADRQTTGGYPRIATVISADLPTAGQLAPGDWIEFAPCARGAAIEALKRQRNRLEGRVGG